MYKPSTWATRTDQGVAFDLEELDLILSMDVPGIGVTIETTAADVEENVVFRLLSPSRPTVATLRKGVTGTFTLVGHGAPDAGNLPEVEVDLPDLSTMFQVLEQLFAP